MNAKKIDEALHASEIRYRRLFETESKLEHLLFGRNIHKIVDGAPCDVMVTRTYLYGRKAAKEPAA